MPDNPNPPSENPAVVEKQIEQVEQGQHKFTVKDLAPNTMRFKPSRGLPVWINYSEPRDPFEIYEEVTYSNGPIKVVIPAGFKCDAASMPFYVQLVPAAALVVLAVLWWFQFSPTLLMLTWMSCLVLSVILPLAVPAVGQLGLHARGAVVHDVLYRTQIVARVVADAVFWEIMEYDKVRWLPKWMIYTLLRFVGGRAWRNNAAVIAAAAQAAAAGETAVVSEPTKEPTAVLKDMPRPKPERNENGEGTD